MSATPLQRIYNGFSITELIIVVAVIGILAGIVIVSYNGIQKKAQDSSVLSDLDATAGLLESYRQDPANSDQFPRNQATLSTVGIKVSKSAYTTSNSVNFVFCINNSADPAVQYKTYALVAESKSGTIFMMTENGLKTFPLTHNDLVSGSVCSLLGGALGTSLGLASSGMYSPGTWQTWVGGS